jgi:hypothetical protein
MKTCLRFLGSFFVIACVGVFSPKPAPASPTPDREIPNLDRAILKEQGIEIAPKGPVHDAFARPFDQNPQPTPPILKEPPPPIPELPAEKKPEGSNVEWIPGYWAWDNEKNDFLWVSGMYRNIPQGRRYVPGYWTHANDGWQWVPGFFAPERQAETQYVPRPPASLDNGPSVPPPDKNSFYTPGIWSYDGSQFAWRPGYWSPYQQGMIWTPSSYTWTPAGWVFVPGYWDYMLANRGLMFAPVYFNSPYWNNPGWFYQPGFALGLGMPWSYPFFYQNGYPGYYYGPYYGGLYAGLGFFPWYGGPFWGNPLFGYYRWHNRGNPGWFNGMRGLYANRGFAPVPVAHIGNINNNRNFGAGRFTSLSAAQVSAQKTTANQFRQLAMNRSRLETSALGQGSGAKSLRLTSGNIGNIGTAANTSGRVGGSTNGIRTPTFNSANLKTPAFNSGGQHNAYLGKQGLTGHAPTTLTTPNFRTPAFNNPAFNKAAANTYQPKTGLTGTTRNGTQVYNTPRAYNSFNSRTGTGSSYLYRPGNAGTYRPSTIYRPSTPAYRGGGYGGGARYGGGGGHMGGGHGGGHR